MMSHGTSRMMAAVALAAAMAGCLDENDGSGPVEGQPGVHESSSDGFRIEQAGPPLVVDINHTTPDSLESIAKGRAEGWNLNAALILVSMFEGDLPAGENRWGNPYDGLESDLGDGLAPAWTFSFAARQPSDAVLGQACEAGVHTELRDAYIVTVAHDGSIVAEYETRDDDEGAPMTGWLRDALVKSSDAAYIAAQDAAFASHLERAAWSQTFLLADWYEAGALHWVFVLHVGAASPFHAYVDAESGVLTHAGDPWPAKC